MLFLCVFLFFQPSTVKWRIAMYNLLVSLARSIAPRMRGVSLYQAEEMLHNGSISQRDYEVYYLFWVWSAPRFGGGAISKRYQYATKRGQDALMKREAMFLAAGKEGGLD